MAQSSPTPLPAQFADTGLHVQRAGTTDIRRYQVLGERSSGTNFVKRLLGRNTALAPTEALGWKHATPHMLAVPHDLAVICVVRRADSWARSMFAKPWHTTPQMQALGFSDFLRAPWDTVIDRPRYFEGLVPDGSVGAPLQADRDPVTGARHANIFALRHAKLLALLGMLRRDCTCILLRMEDAQAAPEATLDALVSALGLPARTAPFRPVVKRLGSKFKPSVPGRPDKAPDWSDDDMAFLRAQIDTDLEAQLGYAY
ncbi:hypothetical protein [uncultured Tateyamaria sp.]|uniref:hypothetical protein n=1 Tax=uncultured Tateyamaria sp. TaxID=455651 RepID=UPI00261312AC|nr:hypothetical protein [uncultured Tateyamaria sp.]